MHVFRALYEAAVEALFPISEAERSVRALSPEAAASVLPPAPPYDGSVAALPRGSRSLLAYKDPRASRLIWSIKYKKDLHSVAIGGYLLRQALGAAPAGTILVSIPVSSRRRRERGYNQCELLLDEVARLDAMHGLVIEKGLLIRSQHRARQTLKGRADRLESAAGIFAVDPIAAERLTRERVPDAPIIIVDDVITTGSTMKAAVDALVAAGFTNVRALSLAH